MEKVLDVMDGKKNVDELIDQDNQQALVRYELPERKEAPSPRTSEQKEIDDKMEKEWAKIRRLEQKLGAANRA